MIYTKEMLEAMILPIMQEAKANPEKATAAIVNLMMQDRVAQGQGFYDRFVEVINSNDSIFDANFGPDIKQNALTINNMILAVARKAAGIKNELPS